MEIKKYNVSSLQCMVFQGFYFFIHFQACYINCHPKASISFNSSGNLNCLIILYCISMALGHIWLCAWLRTRITFVTHYFFNVSLPANRNVSSLLTIHRLIVSKQHLLQMKLFNSIIIIENNSIQDSYNNQGCALAEPGGPHGLASNFCPWATRKSQIFYTNHMLGTLDFTVSEHWASFNFP